ncbi:MAG TPA: ankyrin repeat domain-containing protein [Bryobacteraceae bacterium]
MGRGIRRGIGIGIALACVSVGHAGPLLDAVKAGNKEQVRTLAKNRAEVNAAEADGTTPLDWAVRADDLEIARMLLQGGAHANAANRYGITPLSLAATNGDAAMIEALLKAGADPKIALPGGQTVLMTASHTGNPEAVKALLRHGVDVNAKESTYGETALMWAAAENHAAVVELLIEFGADFNAHTNPLVYPKDRFGLEGVTTILPHGNWTVLMYAARQGATDAARVLAMAGAKMNVTDPDGTTALVLAIINGHYDTAALLTEKGADPNIADTTGMAALYAAVDMSTLGEVYGRPARKSTSKVSPLDLMTVLFAHGANPNATLKSITLARAHTPGEGTLGEGTTPLMRAARNGDAAAIRLLLDHGADPTLAQKNQSTALMLAAGQGRGLGVFAKEYSTEAQMLEAVKVLLDRHVDVNAVNGQGQSALHFAAMASDDIVRLLAANGANLEAKDKQNRTPADCAMGVGMRGRAGGPPIVREQTAALLRQLIARQKDGRN